MQFTGQKAEQPASTACLLARKCNSLARTCIMNMRNATCVRTQTSKDPTRVALLFICYSMVTQKEPSGGLRDVLILLNLVPGSSLILASFLIGKEAISSVL